LPAIDNSVGRRITNDVINYLDLFTPQWLTCLSGKTIFDPEPSTDS